MMKASEGERGFAQFFDGRREFLERLEHPLEVKRECAALRFKVGIACEDRVEFRLFELLLVH